MTLLLRSLCLVAMLWPVAGRAFVTDAFGLFEGADPERAGWAGVAEDVTEAGVTVRRQAPGAARTVLFHLGEKTLVAGGRPGLAAALVLDAGGNLVADGTEVTLASGAETQQAATRRGIAARPLWPGTVAGQFPAGAAVAGWQSGRVEYVVQPDLGSVRPALVEGGAAAQEEAFHEVQTLPMADRFGNAVADGTGVSLRLAHPDGTVTLLPALAEGGVVRGRLLARDVALEAEATAALGARRSAPVPQRIAALEPLGVPAISAEALPDIAAVRLVAGPFLTTAGHLLNDGAAVSLRVTTRTGRPVTAAGWVRDGMFDAVLPLDAGAFPLEVVAETTLGRVTAHLAAPQTGAGP